MYDIIVVGGGLAGWCAAIAAQDAGRSVALIERSTRRPGWGNSMITGGALHASLRDPRTDPHELIRRITEDSDGSADQVVVAAWAANAARTIDWIAAHGGELMSDPSQPHRAAVFAPVRATEPGTRYANFGTPNFLAHCAALFVERGGTIVQPARARALSPADHADDGARWLLDTGDTALRARAVVLADGGFQANRSLMKQYVGTDQYRLRATSTSVGDGLRLGLANGGMAINMSSFYGHLLSRDALTRDDLWPYPILDLLAAEGVLVTSRGQRFVDETSGGVTITNALAWSGDAGGCWLIVDEAAWQGAGRIGVTPPNPWLVEHGATLHTADTIAALAEAANIDAGALTSACRRFTEGPFRAIALIAGVTFTLGGLRVDGHGRLLDHHGTPIDGLYAAGGTMGGLHGGPRAGYAGGLLEAAVFGILAGEHAATLSAN